MKFNKSLLLIVAAITCSSALLAQRGNNKPVQEDLSAIRPRFTTPIDTSSVTNTISHNSAPVVPAVMTVNEKVDVVLDSIDRLNTLRRSVPGYTIVIYSGQNREDAGNAKKKLLDEMDMKSDLQYQQPKFRVRAGYYFTSIDAQRDLVRMRRIFPNAILVPEMVPIK